MTLSRTMLGTSSCVLCDDELEHCHGTAIVHLGRGLECTEEPDCSMPEEVHAYVVLCVELDEACCRS